MRHPALSTLLGLAQSIGFFGLTFFAASPSLADNCLEISLTGTLGGPDFYKDLAGSGTLVKYGSVDNNCGDVIMQFDTGRSTGERLSQLGISANDLDAVFITHLHSDHTVGLVDLAQTRWHIFGGQLDLICSADIIVEGEHARDMSCANFATHIADTALYAGEIEQRISESTRRDTGGPADILSFMPVELPLPMSPRVVWQSGAVSVSAIGSTHIPGHLSFRVDSPAGSVVIGGDAGNHIAEPPRDHSTSDEVELLAQGADVLVHSAIHPKFGPEGGSTFPAPIFYRQSSTTDLGALAKRAGVEHLMLTHLIPVLDAEYHGIFEVPNGPIGAEEWLSATLESGYQGKIYVGKDLMTIRLLESEQ